MTNESPLEKDWNEVDYDEEDEEADEVIDNQLLDEKNEAP